MRNNAKLSHTSTTYSDFKLCFETKSTKLYSKILLVKSSENNFVFLPVFYLIMWLRKASKNFGKMTIMKILDLISLGGVKTHFGKLALKWCICRHEIFFFNWYYVIGFDPIKVLSYLVCLNPNWIKSNNTLLAKILIFSCLEIHYFRASLPKWVLTLQKETGCHIFKIQDLDPLSTSKLQPESQFCERC